MLDEMLLVIAFFIALGVAINLKVEINRLHREADRMRSLISEMRKRIANSTERPF